MRPPDRPETGPPRGRGDSLAERLARLPDRHPSSVQADELERRPEDEQFPAAASEPGEHEEEGPPGPDEAGEQQPGHTAPTGQAASRSSFGPLAAGSGASHGPYRPWFADGGPGQPWFADDGPSPAG